MMESLPLKQNANMNTGDRSTLSYKCKVILVGESGVGKTCLLERFINNEFILSLRSTIIAYQIKVLQFDDCNIKFEIWDTAGQERFRSLIPSYYKEANAAIVIYDITEQISFEKTRWWIEQLREKADNPDLIIILVGNKADLDDKREVPTERAVAYAERENMLFLETSAKENRNVDEVFLQIGKRFLDCSPEPVNKRGLVPLKKEKKRKEENKKKCC